MIATETATATRQCWTCDTTTTTDWFTYQDGTETRTACLDCAIKTDEIALGADAESHDWTVCTYLAQG
jgi:hypothetical protein